VLYVVGLDRIAVVAGDLYFVNPNPRRAEEDGPEQGTRVEVRLLAEGPPQGSPYSARQIVLDRPVWRADLLESVDHPGTLDHAHHHPYFVGWDPVGRHVAADMGDDPVAWLGRRLADLDGLLAEGRVAPGEVGPSDAADLRAAVPEVLDAVGRILARVRSTPPRATGRTGWQDGGARVGWL
jgi:hypothetical protein